MGPLNNGQSPRRPRNTRNVFTTPSGKDIRLNRSFSERRKARKDAMARQRAARLSVLPQNRWKRLLYRLHPKRLAAYWFSREGGIMALKLAGVGMVAGFLLLVGLFAFFRKDLPDISDVSGNSSPGSISYYDSTGKVLLYQDYDAVKRIPVPYNGMNDFMRNATIAIEDKDFYNEGAFNVRGILRAAIHDVTNAGGARQGGSTITQQLVKLNQNWTNDRTYTRKIKELILAVEVEREYSKNDIITGYLNSAPYGGIEVGVESAARDYFGISAKDLSLAQASMLAAVPQAPRDYSPYSGEYFDREALLNRQHYILDQMVNQKMITPKEASEAKKVDVLATVKPLQPKYAGIKAPYFVLAAKDELDKTYLSETTKRGGWKVITTLNTDLQDLAEKQVADGMRQVRRQGGDTAAFVAEDVKTGEIVAAVGNDPSQFSDPNSTYGKLNFAHSVQVSPGSSVKPYDYANFIDKSDNVGAGSVLYDSTGPLPGYSCTKPWAGKDNVGNCLSDYDVATRKPPGPLTLRYSLGGSRNIPAVKAALSLDSDRNKSIAKNVQGIDDFMAKDQAYVCYAPGTDVFSATSKDEAPCYGSSAIGDGAYLHLDDHVNGIATLARLGNSIKKTYISKIYDAENHQIELRKRDTKQVVRPDAAYIVNDMASDPKASYLPSSYICNGQCKFHNYKGWKFAIKTGTTNDGFDGLMTSWSGKYAAVTWVGYHTRTKAMTGNMETMTAPIVRGWMQGATDKLSGAPQNWPTPKGIQTLPAYVVRNHVGVGSIEPSPTNDLFPSWYKKKSIDGGSATIDKISGKRATSCTPSAAKQYVTNSNAAGFSVDQFVNGGAKNTGAVNTNADDDVHRCDDQRPDIDLTVAAIGSGVPTTECDSTGCTVTATISQGTHPLASPEQPGKVTISVNGQVMKSFDINDATSPQSVSYSFIPTGSGSVQISATVTDSVLYDASANASVTATGSGDGGNGDTTTPHTTKPKKNPFSNLFGN